VSKLPNKRLTEWVGAVWSGCRNLERVGQVAITSISIGRRVARWGQALQAVETLQQVKTYELAEPSPIVLGEKWGVRWTGR
jgi:hypothetical protein